MFALLYNGFGVVDNQWAVRFCSNLHTRAPYATHLYLLWQIAVFSHDLDKHMVEDPASSRSCLDRTAREQFNQFSDLSCGLAKDDPHRRIPEDGLYHHSGKYATNKCADLHCSDIRKRFFIFYLLVYVLVCFAMCACNNISICAHILWTICVIFPEYFRSSAESSLGFSILL